MNLNLPIELKAKDLMNGICWHGETNADDEAIRKIEELKVMLGELFSELSQTQYKCQTIATNQNNFSALAIADSIDALFLDVVERVVGSEDALELVPRLFHRIFLTKLKGENGVVISVLSSFPIRQEDVRRSLFSVLEPSIQYLASEIDFNDRNLFYIEKKSKRIIPVTNSFEIGTLYQ